MRKLDELIEEALIVHEVLVVSQHVLDLALLAVLHLHRRQLRFRQHQVRQQPEVHRLVLQLPQQ